MEGRRAASGDTIARNTTFALAAQAATAMFTAGVTLYLVRALGPAEFGVFSLAFGVGALLLLPADFGISQSTARFLAERRGSPADAAAVLASGLRLKLVAAAVLATALFALAEPIAGAYDAPGLVWPLRGIAIALAGQSLMMLYSAAFVALGRTSLNLGVVASESAVEAGTTVVLVVLGAGASGAAFGRAAGYVFGAAAGMVVAVRLLGRSSIALGQASRGGSNGSSHGRRIAGYAGALFVIDGAYTVLGQIDILLIGALLTTTSVGLFQAPWRLTAVLHYPGLAVAAGVAPRLARDASSRTEPDAAPLTAGLRLLLVFQAAFIAPLLVWSGPITDLALGSSFEGSSEVLRLLTPYVFLAGLAPLVSNAVDYLGAARRRIPIALATLAVNFAIDIVLIPKIGIVAGAIGSSAGFAIYVPAHLWLCDRLVGLPLASLAASLARALLAAAAMCGVLLAAGTEDLSTLSWLWGSMGGAAAFAAVLLATGELPRSREALRALRAS